MKKLLTGLALIVLAGCKASDMEIRADIASKAQQDLNFAGLSYTVSNGVVNFTGRCPSEKALDKIQQTIKTIHVIKTVNYHVVVAPVTLDNITLVKLRADSILAQYPQVSATGNPVAVVVKGNVTETDKQKLLQAFARAGISPLKDSLNVK